MIIKNVKVYTEDKIFKDGCIYIQNGIFADSQNEERDTVIDGNGAYAIPGLIDMHLHGCNGYDFCDGTQEAIAEIAKHELKSGVTAFAPATMTLPVEQLESVLRLAADYHKRAVNGYFQGADLVGINMEGPFISELKKGAQDEMHILPCQTALCEQFLTASDGLVKFIGIAPEANADFAEFIAQVKDKVNVSLAHTNADYDTAMSAFEAGANHVVHLHNAMPVFGNRQPGVVGAVADCDDVTAELICDGVHIHPSMVRATFKMLGDNRIVLISDSMRATGMPDGIYTLGGQDVQVQGKCATLVKDGALAGSVTNLMDCVRVAVREVGLPLETAVACTTVNPAKCLGIYGQYGSISYGKRANVVLLDDNLEIKMVVKDGNICSGKIFPEKIRQI